MATIVHNLSSALSPNVSSTRHHLAQWPHSIAARFRGYNSAACARQIYCCSAATARSDATRSVTEMRNLSILARYVLILCPADLILSQCGAALLIYIAIFRSINNNEGILGMRSGTVLAFHI